ncbi:hypothetical protein MKX07_006310 [Trichoderma sp. CBMAI-0711]|nr:hypothetical protein MKX07_006310 [Trichoderma sp. CBMAI-0711]
MALSAQDIVRILHGAAGFIPNVDGTEYYVVIEESNELSEMHWFGSQLAGETFIAPEIRTNSPAVYAVHENTRSVFCVGENNALKLFTLWEDEWHEVNLTGNGNILVHPSSRMSGCVDGSDSLVFFEDFKSQIRGIRVQEDGSWRFLRSLAVASEPGHPHFAQVQNGVVYLSYMNRDDSPLSGAVFSDTHVMNFIVGVESKIGTENPNESPNQPQDKEGFYLLALTKKDKDKKPEELECVDGSGKRTLLGRIAHGMFVWILDKESNGSAIKAASAAVTTATGKPKPKKRR